MNVTSALEPEDEHLSTSEIKSLIQALSVADRLRLARIARFYSRRCPIDGDDLLSESVVAALSGNRRCPRHLNLMAFLTGAMKSIVFNENRKFSNERRAENTDDAVDDSPVARVHDKGSSPEEDAIAESEANAIFELFKDDDDVTMLLMGLYDDYDPDEICEINGWTRTTYDTTRKRLRRGLNKHFPKGRQS